ncbi:MAG: lyase family protein [Kibdelosporangium sp.]
MNTRIDREPRHRIALPADSDDSDSELPGRARRNFAVPGQTPGGQTQLLHAIAQVKKAAALANQDIGVLRPPVAQAICRAAEEIIDGTLGSGHFPVDVLAATGGGSPNTNVNAVIAHRANQLLWGSLGHEFVHPDTHVNAGQSTSDAMATAVNIALHRDILRLRNAVGYMADALRDKLAEHDGTMALSRTCPQDVVTVPAGEAFSAYLAAARRGVDRLTTAAEACLDVPMGVDTALGGDSGYVEAICPRLLAVTGLPLRRHPDFFDAFQNGDVFQYVSAIFKALACGLIRIVRELGLAGGTQAGPGEMPELVVQAGLQVCGNDTVVNMAVAGAELDFDAWTAVIAKNLTESARLLTAVVPLFADKCLRGVQIDTEPTLPAAESSLGLSTVLGGVYGHDASARAAHHAAEHGTSIRQAVVELGIASQATADRLLDPVVLTDVARSATLLDSMLADQQACAAQFVRGLSPTIRHAIVHATSAVAAVDRELTSQE